jgi:hypothetical protein
MQLEAGAFISSYIVSTTAGATRLADVAAVTGLSVPPPYGLYLEAERVADYGSTETMLQLDNGSSADCSRFVVSNIDAWRFQEQVASASTFDTATSVTATQEATFKMACRYATLDCRGAIGGALKAQTTTVSPPTKTIMRIGSGPASALPGNAYFRKIAIFGYGIPDELCMRAST